METLLFLGVPILKHIMVLLMKRVYLQRMELKFICFDLSGGQLLKEKGFASLGTFFFL